MFVKVYSYEHSHKDAVALIHLRTARVITAPWNYFSTALLLFVNICSLATALPGGTPRDNILARKP